MNLTLLVLLVVLTKFPEKIIATMCQETFYETENTAAILTCSDVKEITDLHLLPEHHRRPRHVHFLNITNSSISTIPNQAFVNFHYLRSLHLSGIHLKTIESKAFANLTHLTKLDLSNNELSDVTDIFTKLSRLNTLDLSRNRLHKIENFTFPSLTLLRRLNLAENFITEIEEGAFSEDVYYFMIVMNLSGNPIKTLPKISSSKLDLSNTSLKELNVNMSDWEVSYLDLSWNKLECIDFANVPRTINSIILSNNNIISLANLSISSDSQLLLQSYRIKLVLSFNKLEILDSTFFNQSLSFFELDFSNNAISGIDKNMFLNFSVDYGLRLDHNKITKIHPGTFRNLNNLKVLDLSSNLIEIFPLGSFEGLFRLITLNISNNKLLKLTSYIIHPAQLLQNLDFAENQITFFDSEKVVKKFVQLRKVSLDHNPWTCQNLLKMFQQFTKQGVRISPGEDFDGPNVHGVACMDRGETGENETIVAEQFYNYVRKVVDSDVEGYEINSYLNGSLQGASESFSEDGPSFTFTNITQIVVLCLLLIMIGLHFMFYRNYKRRHVIAPTSRLELVDTE